MKAVQVVVFAGALSLCSAIQQVSDWIRSWRGQQASGLIQNSRAAPTLDHKHGPTLERSPYDSSSPGFVLPDYVFPMSENGYRALAALNDEVEMNDYVHRQAEEEAFVINNQKQFDSFLANVYAQRNDLNLTSLTKMLEQAPGVGMGKGRSAPLTQTGYDEVVLSKSASQMMVYARRILAAHKKQAPKEKLSLVVQPEKGKLHPGTFARFERRILTAAGVFSTQPFEPSPKESVATGVAHFKQNKSSPTLPKQAPVYVQTQNGVNKTQGAAAVQEKNVVAGNASRAIANSTENKSLNLLDGNQSVATRPLSMRVRALRKAFLNRISGKNAKNTSVNRTRDNSTASQFAEGENETWDGDEDDDTIPAQSLIFNKSNVMHVSSNSNNSSRFSPPSVPPTTFTTHFGADALAGSRLDRANGSALDNYTAKGNNYNRSSNIISISSYDYAEDDDDAEDARYNSIGNSKRSSSSSSKSNETTTIPDVALMRQGVATRNDENDIPARAAPDVADSDLIAVGNRSENITNDVRSHYPPNINDIHAVAAPVDSADEEMDE